MPKKSAKRNRKQKPTYAGFKHLQTKKDISEYVLKENGLRVLYMHMPGSGIVTSNIVYLVGSRHERRGETGIAHMLEHMMFKYTGTASSGRRDKTAGWKQLENQGAILNASTWLDRTNYYFNLPTQYFEQVLNVEARRMRHLLIEKAEFAPEQTNVLSEYEMYKGIPTEALEWSMLPAAYAAHTYGHDTIGHKPDIENYTVEKLQSFYDTYYYPDNAVLVVVGDIPKKDALQKIRTVFGKIPPRKQQLSTFEVIELAQEGKRAVFVEKESPVNIFALRYKGAHGRDKNWVVLQLLLLHLTDGKTSVLHKKLIDTNCASEVRPYQCMTHDPFLVGITVHIAKNTTHEDIEHIVLAEIEKIKNKKISKKRLQTLQTKLVSSELYRRDGTLYVAGALTEYIAAGDWSRYYSVLDDAQAATPEDLQKTAQKYFIDTQKTTGYFVGTQK